MMNKGFSLIECLIVMSIICILLGLGITNYSSLWHKNKTRTIVNQIITALNVTRSEAVMQNSATVFCGSSDKMNCDGQWSQGQIIKKDNAKTILRVYSGLSGGDQLLWRSNLGINNYLKYAPTGFTAGQEGSFYYCPKGTLQNGAIIVISFSGRTRVNYDTHDIEKGCLS